MIKKLVNLKTSEYEHGFDKAALKSLRALKGVDAITNFVMNWTYVKWEIVELAGSQRLKHVSFVRCMHTVKKCRLEVTYLVERD